VGGALAGLGGWIRRACLANTDSRAVFGALRLLGAYLSGQQQSRGGTRGGVGICGARAGRHVRARSIEVLPPNAVATHSPSLQCELLDSDMAGVAVLSRDNRKVQAGYVTYRFEVGEGDLTTRVSAFTREDRCAAFYVGITSGEDCLPALRTRMDHFKAENGLHEIVVIAETDNQDSAREWAENASAGRDGCSG
jgi:hypothetical protein